jgi:DNA-binding CsgD family transcriptional regulator
MPWDCDPAAAVTRSGFRAAGWPVGGGCEIRSGENHERSPRTFVVGAARKRCRIDAMASQLGDEPTRHSADTGAHGSDEVARVSIAGHECSILCVDDVLPQHCVATRQGTRAQFVYVEREISHFELRGHRYVIICNDGALPVPVSERDPATAPSDIRELLTNRELQIVQLICMGYVTKQVAFRLHISEFTVRSYLKTIYCKLGVRSRGAMVYRYAQAFSRAAAEERAAEPAREP